MRTLLAALAIPLVFTALWLDRSAIERFDRYGDLVRQYELYPLPASIDIDLDGIPGRIEVIQPNPTERSKLNAVVSDSGRELLRIPYDHTDNTFRTHLARSSDRGQVRLLVFDGTAGRGKVRAVYFLSGHDLVAATPTREDEDLSDGIPR